MEEGLAFVLESWYLLWAWTAGSRRRWVPAEGPICEGQAHVLPERSDAELDCSVDEFGRYFGDPSSSLWHGGGLIEHYRQLSLGCGSSS
jgi:hypothetical protein